MVAGVPVVSGAKHVVTEEVRLGLRIPFSLAHCRSHLRVDHRQTLPHRGFQLLDQHEALIEFGAGQSEFALMSSENFKDSRLPKFSRFQSLRRQRHLLTVEFQLQLEHLTF